MRIHLAGILCKPVFHAGSSREPWILPEGFHSRGSRGAGGVGAGFGFWGWNR